MKGMFRRALVFVLALTLLLGAALPAQALVIGRADDLSRMNIWENSTATVLVGKTLTINMTQLSGNALSLKSGASYASTNSAVASLAEDVYVYNGALYTRAIVTAVAPGEAQIVMQSSDGASYILHLTVVSSYDPTRLYFDKTSMTTYVGMQKDLTTLLNADPSADAIDFTKVTFKSSNKKVVSVKEGVMTAQKAGKATITATMDGSDLPAAKLKVTVKKNKLDKINAKPSIASAGKDVFKLALKSVEIVSPKKVVAEFYLVFNRPSRSVTEKLNYLDVEIGARTSTKKDYKLVVDGRVNNVKVRTSGKTVTTFKVTFTGSTVNDTNINLKKCAKKVALNYWATLKYRG